MERSKIIFGNKMSDSTYRKALNTKKKNIKKFGDDKEISYPVNIQKNQHIGDALTAPPALSGSGLIAYAAVTYILWGVTYTMMDIPFWSMIPAFTEGGKEREGLTTLARSCT